MERHLYVVSLTGDYGSSFDPIYITSQEDAQNIKKNFEPLVKRYNEFARKGSKSMEGYMFRAKVISILPIPATERFGFLFNPYAHKPIIAGFDGLTRVNLYDSSKNSIDSCKEFDRKFKEQYPDYNVQWQYFNLDINKKKEELEKKIDELYYKTLDPDEDEYI